MYAWLIWMILEIISSIRLGITTGQMGHKNWVRAAGAGARRAPGAALGLAQPAGNILRAENINIETILVSNQHNVYSWRPLRHFRHFDRILSFYWHWYSSIFRVKAPISTSMCLLQILCILNTSMSKLKNSNKIVGHNTYFWTSSNCTKNLIECQFDCRSCLRSAGGCR